MLKYSESSCMVFLHAQIHLTSQVGGHGAGRQFFFLQRSMVTKSRSYSFLEQQKGFFFDIPHLNSKGFSTESSTVIKVFDDEQTHLVRGFMLNGPGRRESHVVKILFPVS